ncbi:phosphoglycerate dehydrogenase [Parvularcula sp. IMCC14364]|uniref:phosphoglycerate dehydrogenase n=1 Tax=Parvularcula sp. IMCC14364 TaxID=3067902 RepID=UPI0027415834|nr:phosphoglycerate dehydrogenase [Parvularcula sp. IMCC14364]
MRVLVTCPNMLNLMDEFYPVFAEKGLEGVAATVVQTLSEDELIKMLPDFDGWIIGDDPATRRVFEAGKSGKLKAAVKWGVGIDNVDFDACEELGIPVSNTPGVFGREVADVAIAYTIGLARNLFVMDRKIRTENQWLKPGGISTWNKRAGVVGFGDIGRQSCKRLAALDMEIVAYDPYFKSADFVDVEHLPWPEGLNELDFLIFTCPLNEYTRHMFNRGILPQLKPGVRVINVGRGPVIEEAALVEGLEAGIVASAALDVFEVEPLPANSRLRDFDQCIFGSHSGSNTVDASRHVSLLTIDMIEDFLKKHV